MKKNICLFIITLIIVCSNIIAQSNKMIQGQNILLERDKIINHLREKGDKVLNINNLFEIIIPKNIEIISINQYLLLDKEKTQYGVSNIIDLLYDNKYFFIEIDVYGKTNHSFLDGSKTYNLREIINPHPYKSRNQINYLKENYKKEFITNKNDIKIGKYFSSWGTSWSSDYYGLYFMLQNNEFNECVISIFNIWGTFAKSETIDENYKTEILKTGGTLEKIFKDLELMENSITYKLTEESIKINNGSVGEQIIEDGYIYPIVDNLRMRRQPSLTGEVLGYMKKEMYQVVFIGDKVEIDGIKGNWLLIKPRFINSTTWVFSGYTRKATKKEMERYLE